MDIKLACHAIALESAKAYLKANPSKNEADESDGEKYPASISFSGCRDSTPDEWIDFTNEVEAIPNEDDLAEKSFMATHMSDNLL